MNRREIIALPAGIAALHALPVPAQAAPPAADPDAELIALCTRHAEVGAIIDAMNETAADTDANWNAAADKFAALAVRISAIPAQTFHGLQAKAQAVTDMIRHYIDLGSAEPHERMAEAFAQDVLRAPLQAHLVLPPPAPADAVLEDLVRVAECRR
ncbi:hypothetical protein [Roseomonas marmotae]|uniref:Uncharacterized protein n=1 Tax=Roseomonas marmotae TaxID=2768161 RepID=A0ABS3K7F5_9PROT|nr:hypothetical protein [Roseomonas marmotae]MBO1073365.1 hypothetical protein [Roseomonas marmotae]